LSRLKPCARCEQELPLNQFDAPNAIFCKRCTAEVLAIMRRKYGILADAHFRAQLRQRTKHLHPRRKHQE
jgi:hypothetical protein